jgi:methylated-DNA-[protein]-cysteine S-methyltransferase
VNKDQALLLRPGDRWWSVQAPFGAVVISGNETALHQLQLPATASGAPPLDEGRKGLPRALAKAKDQLEAYFAGALTAFDLPLEPEGTQWQQGVWRALVEVPYGQTATYGEIARRVGKPNASRAVGMANNRNPIAVVIPCHRVIGADGSLTGYGGGLDVKAWLLAHERAVIAGR